MRTQRSTTRVRRIGIALLFLGMVPLLVFAAAFTASRASGGGRAIPGDDLRTFRFIADQVGFAETSPSSSVSIRITVSRIKRSWGPRLNWMPWIIRSDISLDGTLERGDTGHRREMSEVEMSAMLRRHAQLISTSLIGMIWVPSNDVPPMIAEMSYAGETRRSVTTFEWRNVATDLAGWLGGWWRLSLWALMIGTGAVVWWRHRPIPPGHCLWCRYDLRGISAGSPCPECGNVPEEVASPVASP